jgi:hypothetical protein
MVRVPRLLPRSAERPSIPGWPVCCIGVIRTWRRSRWRTRTHAPCGRYSPMTGSSGPTTALRWQQPRFNAAHATQHRRSFHRLLRRSRSDGKTGKTVVGEAQNGRSTSCARKRMRSQPAHSIRDNGNAAPKVRMYGCKVVIFPTSRHELKAWQTEGVHVRPFDDAIRPHCCPSAWRRQRQHCSGSGHLRPQRELTVSATFRSSRRQRDRDADDRSQGRDVARRMCVARWFPERRLASQQAVAWRRTPPTAPQSLPSPSE